MKTITQQLPGYILKKSDTVIQVKTVTLQFWHTLDGQVQISCIVGNHATSSVTIHTQRSIVQSCMGTISFAVISPDEQNRLLYYCIREVTLGRVWYLGCPTMELPIDHHRFASPTPVQTLISVHLNSESFTDAALKYVILFHHFQSTQTHNTLN